METIIGKAREKVELRPIPSGTVNDIRVIGDELTRQRRMRMDSFQTERRLKSAYSNLGEAVYHDLSELKNVNLNDGRIIEILAHIRYYHDELSRLRAETKSSAEAY